MRWPFIAEHVCEVVRNLYSGRVIFYDGDSQIAPGITLHKIGGHSPGLQSLTVMTANGVVVLASAGDPRRIVPGHDPLVLKRYPPLTAASTGIVHRLDAPRTD
jgi:hypothetical protein